jgi:DNA-binding NarL/FixJ family response regulator
MNSTKKRIFLVEDHRLVREGVTHFIGQEDDLIVCGGAANGADALTAIEMLKPDAVLCDISLPGMNGIEFLKNLKAKHPGMVAVVLSMHDEAIYAERALRAGALGYVMKRESAEEVIIALRKALRGEFHVSEKITGIIFHKALGADGSAKHATRSPVELLSDRELEVFEMLGRGMSMRAIAQALSLSPKTVESHRAHIKEKLQFQTVSDILQHAIRWVEHESAGNGNGRREGRESP